MKSEYPVFAPLLTVSETCNIASSARRGRTDPFVSMLVSDVTQLCRNDAVAISL